MAKSQATPESAPPPDDGTIMLVLPNGGDGTGFGHGPVGFPMFYHPQSRCWLLRTTLEAAREYCLRAGAHVAPSELQQIDK
jgi:hypothetical protein